MSRAFVTLVFLENHTPSTEARKHVDFWLRNESMVEVSYVPVSDAFSMKHAKKLYKFSDLPVLIERDGRKSYLYYGEGITAEVDRLREQYRKVK